MPASLQHYLAHHPPLRRLRSAIRQQQDLLQQVQHWLPAPLSTHCHSAALQQNRLILAADSPVWASQLRYQAPDLLHRLRTVHPSIATIRVCTRPLCSPSDLVRSAGRVQRPRVCGQAQFIHDSAQHIEDPVLSVALQKLAYTLSH